MDKKNASDTDNINNQDGHGTSKLKDRTDKKHLLGSQTQTDKSESILIKPHCLLISMNQF